MKKLFILLFLVLVCLYGNSYAFLGLVTQNKAQLMENGINSKIKEVSTDFNEALAKVEAKIDANIDARVGLINNEMRKEINKSLSKVSSSTNSTLMIIILIITNFLTLIYSIHNSNSKYNKLVDAIYNDPKLVKDKKEE